MTPFTPPAWVLARFHKPGPWQSTISRSPLGTSHIHPMCCLLEWFCAAVCILGSYFLCGLHTSTGNHGQLKCEIRDMVRWHTCRCAIEEELAGSRDKT